MTIQKIGQNAIQSWINIIEDHSSLIEIMNAEYWYERKWIPKNLSDDTGYYAYTLILSTSPLTEKIISQIDSLWFDDLLKLPNEYVKEAFDGVRFSLQSLAFQMITISFKNDHSFKQISDGNEMYGLLPYDQPQSQGIQSKDQLPPVDPDPQAWSIYETIKESEMQKKYSFVEKWAPTLSNSEKWAILDDDFDIFASPTAGKSKKLTNREKGLLTLLVEKINYVGLELGAHLNENWTTNITLDGELQEQGVLDRIGKVEYTRYPSITKNNQDSHSINFIWKEPFGQGLDCVPNDQYASMYVQNSLGKYHHIKYTELMIKLYSQEQQSVFECVRNKKRVCNWRPTYDYDGVEISSALKLMAKTFDWQFTETAPKEKKKEKSFTTQSVKPHAIYSSGSTFSFTATYS